MSIGIGNIIVQNKKEPAGVSSAESGLHMDGSMARLGGPLLENTDIDIDTNTFFLQWDGAAGAFLIDVFNDKYFFGTIDGGFNLETGFSFKDNDAAIKLNGNAAVTARGQAGVGDGIVYELGDVEGVNNGTKITISDDSQLITFSPLEENSSYATSPAAFFIVEDNGDYTFAQTKKVWGQTTNIKFYTVISSSSNVDITTLSIEEIYYKTNFGTTHFFGKIFAKPISDTAPMIIDFTFTSVVFFYYTFPDYNYIGSIIGTDTHTIGTIKINGALQEGQLLIIPAPLSGDSTNGDTYTFTVTLPITA